MTFEQWVAENFNEAINAEFWLSQHRIIELMQLAWGAGYNQGCEDTEVELAVK